MLELSTAERFLLLGRELGFMIVNGRSLACWDDREIS